jgi:hypothetical protein
VCFGGGVDDLIDGLHGKVEGHEFTLRFDCVVSLDYISNTQIYIQ